MVAVSFLTIVLLMGSVAAPEPQQVDAVYAQAVDEYRHGNVDGAIANLSTIDESRVVATMNRFWQGLEKLPEQRIVLTRTAVLLHTETWFRRTYHGWPQSAAAQMEASRTLLRRLERLGDDRTFLRDWYLLVTSFLHNGREIATSRPLLEDARKDFPHDAAILLACGVDHEIASVLTTGWKKVTQISPSGRIVEEQLSADKDLAPRELEDAMRDFRAAMTADPESLAAREIRLRLGRILYRRRDFEASARELSAAYASTDAKPMKYLAAVFLAMTEAEQEHFDRARELYTEALRLYPASQTAALGMSELAYRRGQPSEAARVMTGLLNSPVREDPWWMYLLGEGEHFEARLDSLRASLRQ